MAGKAGIAHLAGPTRQSRTAAGDHFNKVCVKPAVIVALRAGLCPQQLVAPARVYAEHFSAHPLEGMRRLDGSPWEEEEYARSRSALNPRPAGPFCPTEYAHLDAVSLKPMDGWLVVPPGGTLGMTLMHYRIHELDSADRVVDGYAVICRSDAAALAMATKGAENRAAAVEVWERKRHVARLDPLTPWELFRRQYTGTSVQPTGDASIPKQPTQG